GMSREDLEELGVPTYGFSPEGFRTETRGDCRVELRISGTDITTTWFNAKNKQVKAVPAEIKRDHSETLKEIKDAALDASTMLTPTMLAYHKQLETLQITPHPKQAYHEIYLLTDAERNTRTYSNRFAAHLIKQHQSNALASARGWKSKLRLMVDDEYTAPCKI